MTTYETSERSSIVIIHSADDDLIAPTPMGAIYWAANDHAWRTERPASVYLYGYRPMKLTQKDPNP